MPGYMFGSFMIVAVVCLTVLIIIKMSLRHAENIKRISNGYPTLDGAGRLRHDDPAPHGDMDRLQ